MAMDKSIFFAGPDPKLELIYSDVWLPGLYSRRILCFELPSTSSHETVIDVVSRALDSLVKGTPELGALSVVIPADKHSSGKPWRGFEAYKGIELVIKDLTKSFNGYHELKQAGFPLAVFKDALFMPIPGGIMPEPQPNAKFQLSLINGGALLSVCLYHHLTDGNGMNAITRALAEQCQKAATTPGSLPPRVLNTDRSRLINFTGTKTDLSLHPAYRVVPDAFVPGVAHDEPKPSGPPPVFRPALYRLTNTSAEALKSAASIHTPVSTHDAISALLWRTSIIARHAAGKVAANSTEPTTFACPHNARRHFGLPKDWVGNCVYFLNPDATVPEALGEDSLALLAGRIRASLNAVDTSIVEGVFEARKPDPYSLAWWPVIGPTDRNVVAITSFYHSELLGLEFGEALGKVRHFTSTDVGALGTDFRSGCFVGPKTIDGRGCDVYVGLKEEEAEAFHKDELWKKYFEEVKEGV